MLMASRKLPWWASWVGRVLSIAVGSSLPPQPNGYIIVYVPAHEWAAFCANRAADAAEEGKG
jgi:hypothetical protein